MLSEFGLPPNDSDTPCNRHFWFNFFQIRPISILVHCPSKPKGIFFLNQFLHPYFFFTVYKLFFFFKKISSLLYAIPALFLSLLPYHHWHLKLISLYIYCYCHRKSRRFSVIHHNPLPHWHSKQNFIIPYSTLF